MTLMTQDYFYLATNNFKVQQSKTEASLLPILSARSCTQGRIAPLAPEVAHFLRLCPLHILCLSFLHNKEILGWIKYPIQARSHFKELSDIGKAQEH